MRIISGIYKSRRFAVPKNFKARPTTDFAKENIFNVIGNLIHLDDALALDLFSGTGSIGFEFLSRGCKEVVCVEQDPFHYGFIRKVKAELNVDHLVPIKGDVFKFLETDRRTFDIIFADPPYALARLPEIPGLVLSGSLLNSGGFFILEHPKEQDFSGLPLFHQRRTYGSVNFSIFINK